jgi:hypothetical protein
MKDSNRRTPATAEQERSAEAYSQYTKDRYAAFILRRNSLCDQAFKTSERYDQWVLTLSGGALAISLTFLEKFAPHPAQKTLWYLGIAWFSYIASLLTGFCAIYFSREALYRERENWDAAYAQFSRTTTEQKPEGEPSTEQTNPACDRVNRLSQTSTACLIIGTVLLCVFALANIPTAAPTGTSPTPAETNALRNASTAVSNTAAQPAHITAQPKPSQTNTPVTKQTP